MRSLLVCLAAVLTTCTCAERQKPLPTRGSLTSTFAALPDRSQTPLRVLDDNTDAWLARLRLLEGAKTSIDTTYFIVEPDAFGLAWLGLLAEKARAGVKVRLMLDARGSFSFINSDEGRALYAVADAGADVRLFHPVNSQLAKLVTKLDLKQGAASDHDKLIVVDGVVAMVGGRNIADDYLADPRDLKTAYTDMDVVVEGADIAAAVDMAFATEWERGGVAIEKGQRKDEADVLALALAAMRSWIASPAFTPAQLKSLDGIAEDDDRVVDIARVLEGSVVSQLAELPKDPARDRLRAICVELSGHRHLRGARGDVKAIDVKAAVVDSVALEGIGDHAIFDALVQSIVDAKTSVMLQTPYLVLSEMEVKALADASARGVDITIMTNSPLSSDSAPTQGAFLAQWPKLAARVPRARIFVISEERLMHAKVFVVDHRLSFVGSYNIDPLSRGVNSELVVATMSPAVAARLEGLVQVLIDRGPPRTYEYKIVRDERGNPVVNNGEVAIAFGPDNHLDQKTLASAKAAQPFADLLHPFL